VANERRGDTLTEYSAEGGADKGISREFSKSAVPRSSIPVPKWEINPGPFLNKEVKVGWSLSVREKQACQGSGEKRLVEDGSRLTRTEGGGTGQEIRMGDRSRPGV